MVKRVRRRVGRVAVSVGSGDWLRGVWCSFFGVEEVEEGGGGGDGGIVAVGGERDRVGVVEEVVGGDVVLLYFLGLSFKE